MEDNIEREIYWENVVIRDMFGRRITFQDDEVLFLMLMRDFKLHGLMNYYFFENEYGSIGHGLTHYKHSDIDWDGIMQIDHIALDISDDFDYDTNIEKITDWLMQTEELSRLEREAKAEIQAYFLKVTKMMKVEDEDDDDL